MKFAYVKEVGKAVCQCDDCVNNNKKVFQLVSTYKGASYIIMKEQSMKDKAVRT